MDKLFLDYNLRENGTKGYTLQDIEGKVSGEIRRQIWYSALPKGKGWNADEFRGVQILKCFELSDGRIAISQVENTNETDEGGRSGIMRSSILVASRMRAISWLQQRLTDLIEEDTILSKHAHQIINSRGFKSQLIYNRHRSPDNHTFDKRSGLLSQLMGAISSKAKGQIILTWDFSKEHWKIIEIIMLSLVTRKTNVTSEFLESTNDFINFTTLALDYRDENRIIAIPTSKFENLENHVSHINLGSKD